MKKKQKNFGCSEISSEPVGCNEYIPTSHLVELLKKCTEMQRFESCVIIRDILKERDHNGIKE